MMYFGPGAVSATSAFATLPIDSLAGDSNFMPGVLLPPAVGQGRASYFVVIVAALFSAGATLSVSVPCSEGHIPPDPAGLVPQTVVKPNRTFESSVLITDSIAVFSVYQAVSFWLSQTGFEESRQWNMLPERSTSR